MARTDAGLVDIAREFLLAHRELRGLFERHRLGTLRWNEVQRMVIAKHIGL